MSAEGWPVQTDVVQSPSVQLLLQTPFAITSNASLFRLCKGLESRTRLGIQLFLAPCVYD